MKLINIYFQLITEFKTHQQPPTENSFMEIHSIILTQPVDEIEIHRNEKFYEVLVKYHHVHNMDQRRMDKERNPIFYPREDIRVVRELTPYRPYRAKVKRQDTTDPGAAKHPVIHINTRTVKPITSSLTSPKPIFILNPDEYGKEKMKPCIIISSITVFIAAVGILYCLILLFLLNIK